LGMTNMAACLMGQGYAYDSDEGRAVAAMTAGFVTGTALQVSAEMAAEGGAFDSYAAVEKRMLSLVREKAGIFSGTAYMKKGVARRPAQVSAAACPDNRLAQAAQEAWQDACKCGGETGFRHAHVTGMDTETDTQALLGAQ